MYGVGVCLWVRVILNLLGLVIGVFWNKIIEYRYFGCRERLVRKIEMIRVVIFLGNIVRGVIV